MKIVQQCVGTQQWPYIADPRDQYQIMLRGLRGFRKDLGELGFVKRRGQSLRQSLVTLVALFLEGTFEQVAALEVFDDEVEQVDVLDPEVRFRRGDFRQQEFDVLPDPKFIFGSSL